jgi:exportin-2 (importin alpha re-exporter)
LTFRSPTFLALLDLFTLPQDITYTGGNAADDLLELDPEEAGFQSSFSKLGASEKSVHNPVAQVGDAKVYASREISTRSKERTSVVSYPDVRLQGLEAEAADQKPSRAGTKC